MARPDEIESGAECGVGAFPKHSRANPDFYATAASGCWNWFSECGSTSNSPEFEAQDAIVSGAVTGKLQISNESI
jgi:hypothetical protein